MMILIFLRVSLKSFTDSLVPCVECKLTHVMGEDTRTERLRHVRLLRLLPLEIVTGDEGER